MEKVLFSKDRGLTERVTFEQRPEGDTKGSVLGRGNSQGKGPEGGTEGGTGGGPSCWSTASSS